MEPTCFDFDEATTDWTKALDTDRIHDINYTSHAVYVRRRTRRYDSYRESSENFYYEERGREICAIYIAHRETMIAYRGKGKGRISGK